MSYRLWLKESHILYEYTRRVYVKSYTLYAIVKF